MSEVVIRRLEAVAVIVDAVRDDVAVAREAITAGTDLESVRFGRLVVRGDIAMGHRFAIRAVQRS